MEILILILTSFWPFMAALIFLAVIVNGIVGAISAIAEVVWSFRRDE